MMMETVGRLFLFQYICPSGQLNSLAMASILTWKAFKIYILEIARSCPMCLSTRYPGVPFSDRRGRRQNRLDAELLIPSKALHTAVGRVDQWLDWCGLRSNYGRIASYDDL